MKKIIPILVLLISPYIFILSSLLVFILENGFTVNALDIIVRIYGLICLFVFLPNIVYAYVLLKKGYSAKQLLFWNMLLKLCNIPIYILVFLIGMFMTITIVGIMIVPFLILFDYLLLIPSTMYGISGLIKAYKDNKISKSIMIGNIILQLIFGLDVISAVVCYINVRKISNIN